MDMTVIKRKENLARLKHGETWLETISCENVRRMNEDMRTAEKFMQAVNAMKNALDTDGLEKNLDLEIAARHNLRRKLQMIKSLQGLYRYLHGNGEKPKVTPSMAFNPYEGVDKTNIHYIFKAMMSVPPWELHKDLLVIPVAITLLLIEVAIKLFPNPKVFRYQLLVEAFINRWTLPKFRPEWSDEELQRQIDEYVHDMKEFEEKFKAIYSDLSVYFGSIETPDKDPVVKKIDETHKRTKKLSEKLCPAEENASFVAQEKALTIWDEYRNSPEVKAKFTKKDHRITYADVFDYCRRTLHEIGFKSAASFKKAIKAAHKRSSRSAK